MNQNTNFTTDTSNEDTISSDKTTVEAQGPTWAKVINDQIYLQSIYAPRKIFGRLLKYL